MVRIPRHTGILITILSLAAFGAGCPKPTDPVCGDGVVDAGEACDDGNTTSGDGCSAECTVEETGECGDGVVDAGEACDDGNTTSGDGCAADCTLEETGECGDGVLDAGEACDDGNTTSGDGCAADCTLEEAGECGDGVLDAGEGCDDGNTTSGDGCSSTCTVESVGGCGDGVLDPGEACDDGNLVSGDGCESDCTLTDSVVVCSTPAPIASGVCEVTSGDARRLITANLLAPEGIMQGGQVLVENGRITCVGCDCAAGAEGATQIVCPEGVLSPGLINSHDHITYVHNDPYTNTGERYEHRHDWRRGIRGHTKISSSGGASADQIRFGELRFVLGGATSVVGSGSASGFLRNLDKNEQEGLGQMPVHYSTFPLGDSDGTLFASGCGYSFADTEADIAGDDAYVPHVAEGIDVEARNEFLCTSSDINGGHDLAEPQSGFIHSIGLSPIDYAVMAQNGTAVIWSPRSNVTLYGDTAQVTVAARTGARIALGTDWMPTGSMNMQRELQCADYLNRNYYGGFFSDRELWRMATLYGAEVAAVDDVLGSLREGLVADLALFDGSTHQGYRAVIEATADSTVLVLRGGTPLYGDADVIAGLATGCDTLDVCGTQKQICATADIGKSLSALQASAGAMYPLFFCAEPANEPSCHPTRPESVNGSTIYTGQLTATDADGDGIADAADNCPTVFNPIRPVDDGQQGDADTDGLGDVCDPCPLDADTEVCTTIDPNDLDKDGVPLATDNCPNSANADQADSDGDGKGDVCDGCPDTPNPGSLACPVSIYAIKSGQVTGGVGVENAIVTACAPGAGYFVQVKEGDAGYAGVEDSAIFVYERDVVCGTTVSLGDRVTLNPATVEVFWGQTELTGAALTILSSGEALPVPHLVDSTVAASTVATGLEGLLVEVRDVSVTDIAPAPGAGDSAPTGEFEVDGALRVDDLIHAITPFPEVGTTFASLTGVLAYRNGNQKLLPRSADDVLTGPPVLRGFSAASTFARVGAAAAATVPEPLEVVLTGQAQGDTFVAVSSADPGSLTVEGGGVTIPDGARSATVLVQGLAQAASVELTATLDADTATASVRVLGDAEQPLVVSLEPASLTMGMGGTETLTVGLDIPAGVGGNTVGLAVAGGLLATVPASVLVPQDALSATFDLTADAVESAGQVTATLGTGTATANVTVVAATGSLVINEVDYDQPGADGGEFVEIFNGSATAVDLTGLQLVLFNGSGGAIYDTVDLGPAGSLASGAYLVVGSQSLISGLTGATIAFSAAENNVQNGSPDGLALVDSVADVVLDALSYEGGMTSVTLASGTTVSLVEGTAATAEDSNAEVGSLSRLPDGADTDDAATDWAFTSTPTPGAANVP